MNDTNHIRVLAQRFLDGEVDDQQFTHEVTKLGIAATAEANVDLDRLERVGYPEVIFAEGKTIPALLQIVDRLNEAHQPILATRVSAEQAVALLAHDPNLVHSPAGRTVRSQPQDSSTRGVVAVVTAGTSDLPVAEEAAETLRWMNVDVITVKDVGVAGPHRLPAHLDKFQTADAVVVVAGMEGALPSVVAGYLSVPVIAVPTSVGYGANLGGIAALLSMLNSCAANVAVVNIDAGFKGGYLAGMIAQQV